MEFTTRMTSKQSHNYDFKSKNEELEAASSVSQLITDYDTYRRLNFLDDSAESNIRFLRPNPTAKYQKKHPKRLMRLLKK